MKVESVSLKGFRCFGDKVTTIRLSDRITALVGANGSGKTALLEALTRVFGVTRDQRTIRRSDFCVLPGTPSDDRNTRELFIDVRLVFPELLDESSAGLSIPHFFHHLVHLITEGGRKLLGSS